MLSLSRPKGRLVQMLAALLLVSGVLTACSPPSAAPESAGPSASTDSAYPLTLDSPYGTSVLERQPVRVATVSAVDTDIALALGVVPVTGPRYGTTAIDPWTTTAAQSLGTRELPTYDSTDGTDFEAIVAAAPDVILATSGWTLADDYSKLAKIAPVVSYLGKDGLSQMTWRERTTVAASALGVPDKGRAAIAAVDTAFDQARTANPAFAGKTFTYAVLHPDQISYISHADADNEFFTELGFTLPANADRFTGNNGAVSLEQIDLLDADVLMVGYPFGDEGVLTQQAFENNLLFKQLTAVRDGHYLVIDDAVASPLAYPTPLSTPWALDRLLPKLQKAVSGD